MIARDRTEAPPGAWGSEGRRIGKTASTEHALANGAQFPGVYPDGSKALSPDTRLIPLTDGGAPALPTTGLADCTRIGTPTFSPDGELVAFNPVVSALAARSSKKKCASPTDCCDRSR